MPLFANQVKLCAWIRKFVAWAVDFRGIMFFAITKSCIFSFVQILQITQQTIEVIAVVLCTKATLCEWSALGVRCSEAKCGFRANDYPRTNCPNRLFGKMRGLSFYHPATYFSLAYFQSPLIKPLSSHLCRHFWLRYLHQWHPQSKDRGRLCPQQLCGFDCKKHKNHHYAGRLCQRRRVLS